MKKEYTTDLLVFENKNSYGATLKMVAHRGLEDAKRMVRIAHPTKAIQKSFFRRSVVGMISRRGAGTQRMTQKNILCVSAPLREEETFLDKYT